MASLENIRNESTTTILAVLIVAGLAFYLAITTSDAVKATINRVLPDDNRDNKLLTAWISFGVSVIVVFVALALAKGYIKTSKH